MNIIQVVQQNPDIEELVKTVLEHEEDVTPRLVLADELTGIGSEDAMNWGELIRLDCELDQLSKELHKEIKYPEFSVRRKYVCIKEKRYHELTQRKDALLRIEFDPPGLYHYHYRFSTYLGIPYCLHCEGINAGSIADLYMYSKYFGVSSVYTDLTFVNFEYLGERNPRYLFSLYLVNNLGCWVMDYKNCRADSLENCLMNPSIIEGMRFIAGNKVEHVVDGLQRELDPFNIALAEGNLTIPVPPHRYPQMIGFGIKELSTA